MKTDYRISKTLLSDKTAMNNILKTMVIIVSGVVLFIFYINFVTYKGELSGEQLLYVKMDGKTGSVLKVNNKYLKNQASIKNSRNFDYGFYLIKYRIRKVNEKNGFLTIEGKIVGYKGSRLNGMRRYILNIFDELFITEDNLYAFSRAAILGEKSEVGKDMKDRFKYTGLAHLIVISGSHIGLVIIGIVKILDTLNIKYRIKYIAALAVLSLYCTLVGMSPGILRAYIMGAMMICARIFFEQEDSKKSLFISLAVILVLNPYAIFDISMQLSYMAVAAIIFVYPPVEKLCEIKFLGNMKTGLVKDTVKLMLLSLTIQITSIPLFLYYFDKLPLFSFLLNIVGVPLGTILIEVLFFITLCNILYLKILNILFIPLAKIIYNGFEGFIFLGNKVPLLQVDINGKVDIWSVAVYYIILVTIIIYMKKSYTVMAEQKKIQEKKKAKLQKEMM